MQPDGTLLARAPYLMPESVIRAFVRQNGDRIEAWKKKLDAAEKKAEASGLPDRFTKEDLRRLAKDASKVIPEWVRHYAEQSGISYGRITIRAQRTRWGSCSAKGNLNFNCLLMLTPQAVIDSVVVHELCHRRHMDHSPAFYNEVRRMYPEYDRWNRWLKKNGQALLKRLPD
jgi:predicted metal-dependent hydrolase